MNPRDEDHHRPSWSYAAVGRRVLAGLGSAFAAGSLITVGYALGPSAAPPRQAFAVAADAYVDAAAPVRSHGRTSSLRVSVRPRRLALITFPRVEAVEARSLELRLFIRARSRATAVIAPAETFLEDVTYRTRPRLSSASIVVALKPFAWNVVDVTRLNSQWLGALQIRAAPGSVPFTVDSRERGRGARLAVRPAAEPTTTTVVTPVVSVPGVSSADALLTAAGDIATCRDGADAATAALIDLIPGTVAPLGDTDYNGGALASFTNCYAPTWGRFIGRSRPAIGNHEYETMDAAGYFSFFGPAAGPAGLGYYSYDLASWHVVVLNSECYVVPGGCGPESPQLTWLRSDLASHRTVCTLAYWHEPLFSSGMWNSRFSAPFWRELYDAGADVVLNGHEHFYERFAPQNPSGEPDPTRGIRQFIVGTGSAPLFNFVGAARNSEVKDNTTYGVLTLALRPGSYEWRFNPAPGAAFRDAGTGACR